MAINHERPKPKTTSNGNIVQTWMDKPGAMMTRLEDLPSDVAKLVRTFDERPARRAMQSQFTVGAEVGGESVILAHFDALRAEGKSNAADMAVGRYYSEFIRPNQPEWSLEELRAHQESPERRMQRIQDEKQASLRRYDALIKRLDDTG